MSPVERVPSSAQTPRTHEGGTRHRGNRSTDARGRSGRGTGRRRGRGARRRPARGTAGKPAGAAHPTSPKSHRLQGGGRMTMRMSAHGSTRWFPRLTGLRVLMAVAMVVGAAAPSALAASKLEVQALSGYAGKVTGGDVLVRVGVPSSARLEAVRVLLNGQDATSHFRLDPANRGALGL